MAQTEQLFLCPVCLDLLQTPVTLPCGHNYCQKCVQDHWDNKEEQRLYTCPECCASFTPRPVLSKNILLAALLEQRGTAPPADPEDLCADPEDLCGPRDLCADPEDLCADPQDLCGPRDLCADPQDLCGPRDLCADPEDLCADPEDLCADPQDRSADPEDVSCDVCTGAKLRAVQSCLQCVASFCERHIQPHYDVAVFRKHQLVAPLHTLQENMCSEHHEQKKLFCRTDQEIIFSLCSMDQHKGHETVSSASERAQRQVQLEAQRDLLLQDVQHKDKELSSLQQQEQDIRDSALRALQLSRDSFRDMILLLETRAKEVEQQIQSEEERGLSRVREIQDQVKQELRELKKILCDLDTLSLTKDHNSFLQLHTALASHSQGPVPVRVHIEARSPFEERTRAVSELRERLQLTVEEGRTNICRAQSRDPLLTTEAKTREELLQYSTDFTLDTNTAHRSLALSDGNRRATRMSKQQKYLDHQDRFSGPQVLSRERVTGRCYWEVEWSSESSVIIAVSYKDIQRKGASGQCRFGNNNRSWALYCGETKSSFVFNSVWSRLSGPVGCRIGVFLDHSAGLLSLYDVSANMRLMHKVETTFSQPLHVGFGFYNNGDSALFSKLK
ncbi:unnamed protein product [Knipowitschia caucasica]